jgi:hypothetical protein
MSFETPLDSGYEYHAVGVIFGARLASFRGRVLSTYEDVSQSSRTGRLERELKMVQLSATKCSCIAIL